MSIECFCHVGPTTETASCDALRPTCVSSSLKQSEAGFWEKINVLMSSGLSWIGPGLQNTNWRGGFVRNRREGLINDVYAV